MPDPNKFVQARNYRPGRILPIRLVVVHDMEAAETVKTAENVASYFATQALSGTVVNGKIWKGSSAHYNVDSDSIVQSVKEEDTAFSAPPCNPDGIHVELAGYAKQTPAEWADQFSTAMLDRAATLIADICQRHMIPPVVLDEVGLLAGRRGITTHATISRAYKKSDHQDPGKSFPLAAFVAAVAAKMGAPAVPAAPTPPNVTTQLGQAAALVRLGYELAHGLPAAARAFQADHGLTADGLIGPLTRSALLSALAEMGHG